MPRPHPERNMKVRRKSDNTKSRRTQVRQELGLRDRKQGLDKRHYDINHIIRRKENLGKRDKY